MCFLSDYRFPFYYYYYYFFVKLFLFYHLFAYSPKSYSKRMYVGNDDVSFISFIYFKFKQKTYLFICMFNTNGMLIWCTLICRIYSERRINIKSIRIYIHFFLLLFFYHPTIYWNLQYSNQTGFLDFAKWRAHIL